MKTLIGGAITSVLGLIGMAIWSNSLKIILTGVIPPVLLIGGCFALYIGFDELKSSWTEDDKDKY